MCCSRLAAPAADSTSPAQKGHPYHHHLVHCSRTHPDCVTGLQRPEHQRPSRQRSTVRHDEIFEARTAACYHFHSAIRDCCHTAQVKRLQEGQLRKTLCQSSCAQFWAGAQRQAAQLKASGAPMCPGCYPSS